MEKLKNKNIFPLDIGAVKQYGIARWQRDFFWPVSDHEYVALANDIELIWRAFIEQKQKGISSILFHARGLRVDIQHFLHAIWVLERIKEQGFDPICSEDTPWFSRLLSSQNGCGDSGDISSRRFLHHFDHERALRKAVNGLKKRIRTIQCNSIKQFVASLRAREWACTFGAPYGIVKDYIKRFPYWVSVTYPSDWAEDTVQPVITPSLADELCDIQTKFFDAMCEVAKKYSIPLSQGEKQYIFATIKRHMFDSARLLECIRGKSRVHGIEHFIASNLRSSVQLAIALAVREHGGKVTSFTHGGHVGLFRSPTMSMSEFALSDEFVMFSSRSSPLFKKIYESNPPPFGNNVTFVGAEHTPFLDLKRRMRGRLAAQKGRRSPQSIKTVMIVGFPYSPWRKEHPGSGLFWAMRLDFELRLIQALSKLGYNVLYKVHPDREKEAGGIFDSHATIVKGDVRELLDIPDAFFFGAPRTTAIAFALCTAKPIAVCVLKEERQHTFPEALERLEKRCEIVSTWFDERNRIQFNESNLSNLFTEKQKWANTEYVNEYLFPQYDGQ